MSLSIVECQSLRPSLLAKVEESRHQCPLFSEAAKQIFSILNTPDCSVTVLAGALQWDPRLAARVLAFANSALYAPPAPIDRLDQAIVLIGMEELRSVILSASAAEFVGQLTFAQERVRNTLCRHACLTAILCRRIGQQVLLSFQGEEFTSGLLHDIGRFLLAAFAADVFATADNANAEEGDDTLEQERHTYGIDHCELGEVFGQVHRLPSTLTSSIAFHHAPQNATQHASLVTLVSLADQLANGIRRGTAVDPYLPEEDPIVGQRFHLLQAVRRLGSAPTREAVQVQETVTPVHIPWLNDVVKSAQRQADTMAMLFSGRDVR